MFKRLAVLTLTALVSATFIAPTVFAGNDAEKNKLNREKVRAKYTEDKGGFAYYDLVYWVDVAKLEDSRWSVQALREPKHDRGLQLYANWVNTANAEGMNIKVLGYKFLHEEREGNIRRPFSYPFNNLGESVRCSDMKGMLEGFYEDWKRGASDVIEDQCEKPKKSKFKVPKMQAAAVGTDPELKQRVRREWYAWNNGKEMSTYIIEIRYGPALYNKERLVAKGAEFVKNLKEIKDKIKW